MKAYKLVLLVLDFENYGAERLRKIAEQARGLDPSVMSIEEADIGEWSDAHPLNNSKTAAAEFDRLFPVASLIPTEQQPVAWRIRIGDSDMWGYSDTESDADFYGKQSGLKYEKQPVFATPTPAVIARPAQTLLDSHINHTANVLHGKTPPVAAPVSQQESMPDLLREVWQQALADVSFYVLNHCTGGDYHAEAILNMPLPKFYATPVEQTSSGAGSAGEKNTCPRDCMGQCPKCRDWFARSMPENLASLPVAAEMRPDLASLKRWFNGEFGIAPFSRAQHKNMPNVPTYFLAADVERLLAPTGLTVEQEPKYGGSLFNRASGETIPADEPVFIFRARDCHAQHVLEEYASVLIPGHHRDAVVSRLCDFAAFERAHPDRMKEPDTAVLAPTPAPTKEPK